VIFLAWEKIHVETHVRQVSFKQSELSINGASGWFAQVFQVRLECINLKIRRSKGSHRRHGC
jgi:hypothetical protein